MRFIVLLSLLPFVISTPLLAMYEPIELARMAVEITNNTQKKYVVSVYNGSGRDEYIVEPTHVVKKDVVLTERNYDHTNRNHYVSQIGVIHKTETFWKDQLTIEVAHKNLDSHRQFGTNLYSHPTGELELEKRQQRDSHFFQTVFPQAHDFITRVSLKGENLEESTMEVVKSASLTFSQMSIRSTAQLILQDRMGLLEAKTKLPPEVFEQAVDWMEKTASPKLHKLMLAYLKS